MKKYIIAIGLLSLFGCNDDHYEELNVNPMEPSEVPATFLLTSATKSLFDRMISTNVNDNIFRLVAQYWNETTYTGETNYDLTERNINGRLWTELYTDVLFDLKDAKTRVQETEITGSFPQEMKDNQVAIIGLMEVYTWQILVDTFGDIPYSEALQGLDNTLPAYDDAATIYADLLTRVSTDISSIDTSADGFGSDDIIYEGDVAKWKKFGASLKLKLAMQLADVNTSVAQTAVTEAVSAGVFTSNDDNFTLFYLPAIPNNNPLYTDLVQSGRTDFVAANTIIDYMNPLNDPRRSIYFRENLGAGVFVGATYGNSSSYVLNSQPGDILHTIDLPGTLLDYAEVEFLLAEATERGFAVGGTAVSHYNAAITANMEYWGVNSSDITTYLAQPDVAYATAPGTWKEKIGKQFWLAMYNRGFEGWTHWRRLDAPTLNIAAFSQQNVPHRYIYPVDEYLLNGTNCNAAASAIGGDELTTKLFWDVN